MKSGNKFDIRVRTAAGLLLVMALFSACAGSAAENHRWRTVLRIVDGDTLLLDGRERVRLIGVNTPESADPRRAVEAFGKEAAAFTASLVQGRRVRLEYDRERRDRHGRTLAYVFLEDGRMVNGEIIRAGYGYAMTRYPFRRMEEFRAYEREARESRRGLWATR